jgi:uncharacterized protein YrzB (UPF0473 family)
MEREPDGTLITLLDEEGNERQFEHLATLEHEGSSYVALVPAFQEPNELLDGDGELIILKMINDENGESLLSSIDDDDEFDAVSTEFEKLLEEEYEIDEEDEDEDDDVEDDDDSEE